MLLSSAAGPEPKPEIKGENRSFRVWLDANQYQLDMTATLDGKEVIIYNIPATDHVIRVCDLFSGRVRDVQYYNATQAEGEQLQGGVGDDS